MFAGAVRNSCLPDVAVVFRAAPPGPNFGAVTEIFGAVTVVFFVVPLGGNIWPGDAQRSSFAEAERIRTVDVFNRAVFLVVAL